MTAKTTTERVRALRAARAAAGLVRLELYAHPDDWAQIKALAERLNQERNKAPSRLDPDSFDARADAMMAKLMKL